MRIIVGLVACVMPLLVAPTTDAIAGDRHARASSMRHRRAPSAVARPHPAGGDAVYVSGRLLWRAEPHQRLITRLRWSKQRDAIAFATAGRFGAVTLVVVLVGGDVNGHTMTWGVPRNGRRSSDARVIWLGARRVGFGHSSLRPEVVASWRIRQ